MSEILVGTSSWTDPTLVNDADFYPPGARTAEGRLKYYASRFPLVEVDSTYYFPPSVRKSVRSSTRASSPKWSSTAPDRPEVARSSLT